MNSTSLNAHSESHPIDRVMYLQKHSPHLTNLCVWTMNDSMIFFWLFESMYLMLFYSLLNDTNDLIWIWTIFGVSQMNIFIYCAFDISSRIGKLFFSFHLSDPPFFNVFDFSPSTINRSIRHSTIGNRLLKNQTSKKWTVMIEMKQEISLQHYSICFRTRWPASSTDRIEFTTHLPVRSGILSNRNIHGSLLVCFILWLIIIIKRWDEQNQFTKRQ